MAWIQMRAYKYAKLTCRIDNMTIAILTDRNDRVEQLEKDRNVHGSVVPDPVGFDKYKFCKKQRQRYGPLKFNFPPTNQRP